MKQSLLDSLGPVMQVMFQKMMSQRLSTWSLKRNPAGNHLSVLLRRTPILDPVPTQLMRRRLQRTQKKQKHSLWQVLKRAAAWVRPSHSVEAANCDCQHHQRTACPVLQCNP